MNLYFLRHGIAADAEEFAGSDAERPLTKEGRNRMEREARALARLGVEVDAVITSPLLRARQTAEIALGAVASRSDLVVDDRLGPDFDIAKLRELLSDRANCDALMIVGHEPSMSATLSALIGGGTIELKKGGVARVNIDDPSTARGTLEWLLTPKVLR